ncbi:MAG: hypothetical protein EU532_09225 [Promethearchaeota archaeon]|nr:MAG: hypothetical protein EU532_09225 [Candidatus Lokiarchaeota archaeon]
MRRRRIRNDSSESKDSDGFRAVINDSTSLSMYKKGDRALCIIRKNLAKDYDIEVDASEAPVLNKFLTDPAPYESSMADIKIINDEVVPVNDALQNVFGNEKDLNLYSVKMAIGGSKNDYVTIDERDLIKYDVKPTLSGLIGFIKENDESILGFLDREYINEEGNVIYLNCGRKSVTDNISSIKLKILASMQQRGYFLQQEHKYYGLQLYIIVESKVADDDKIFEFLKELEIDWELIFFRRRLAIHDWTQTECERNTDNLKNYLRSKYKNLNYFDVNNITRLVIKNQLPFIVADKMASLLFKMKTERVLQLQEDHENQYQIEQERKSQIEEERFNLLEKINELKRKQHLRPTNKIQVEIEALNDEKLHLEQEKRKILEKLSILREKINEPGDEYSTSLKKAEIAAAANLACAYLGISQKIEFDRDVSITEILKYQEELTNI